MKDIQIDGIANRRSGSGEQSENAASGDGGHEAGSRADGNSGKHGAIIWVGRAKPEHANER